MYLSENKNCKPSQLTPPTVHWSTNTKASYHVFLTNRKPPGG